MANKAALSLIVSFRLRRDLSPPGHLGLEVATRADFALQTFRTLKLPSAFQLPAVFLSDKDRNQIAEPIVRKHLKEFHQARAADPDQAWASFGKIAESYLRRRCRTMKRQGEGGRNVTPRFETQATAASAASKGQPLAAETRVLKNAFAKLRQCKELRVKLTLQSQNQHQFRHPQDEYECITLSKQIRSFINN